MLATASLVLAASRTRSDPLFWQEWATNCMNLSTYYIANALFGKAQHCGIKVVQSGAFISR
mgnify:CR=1 FL=1